MTDAKRTTPVLVERAKGFDLSTERTDLRVVRRLLADADNELWVLFDDFPVKLPNTEPAVIDWHGIFHRITYKIENIHRVSTVIRLLDKNLDPEFVVSDSLFAKSTSNGS